MNMNDGFSYPLVVADLLDGQTAYLRQALDRQNASIQDDLELLRQRIVKRDEIMEALKTVDDARVQLVTDKIKEKTNDG